MSSTSSGSSHTLIDMHGDAETVGHGHSRGTSRSEGISEAFITKWDVLPTELYTLEEQLHRMTGLIMTLPPRELIVKIEAQPPIRTRTADLTPAYKSLAFKSHMLPLFLKNAAARSPYLLPAAAVDADIAARIASRAPSQKQKPDFTTPEPMPVVDQPEQFAAAFWRNRRVPTPDDEPPKPKPKKPRGRRPLGDLKPAHDRFRVVDGDKDG
jgi:hypothetical protein